MAKLVAPYLSLDAHGSIASRITVRRAHLAHLAGATPHPINPDTDAQHIHRWDYQYYSRVWHAMTTAERAIWVPPAHIKHTTPYAYYMRNRLQTPLTNLRSYPCSVLHGTQAYDLRARTLSMSASTPAIVQLRGAPAWQFDGVTDTAQWTQSGRPATAWTVAFWADIAFPSVKSSLVADWNDDSDPGDWTIGAYSDRWWVEFWTTTGHVHWEPGLGAGLSQHVLTWNGAVVKYYRDNTQDQTAALAGSLSATGASPTIATDLRPGSPKIAMTISHLYVGPHYWTPADVRRHYTDILDPDSDQA